jgi:head-tail adaptor
MPAPDNRAGIGARRHRLTLQRLDVESTDDFGQEREVWVSVGEYWGLVEFEGGSITEGGRGLYERTGTITLRRVADVKAGTHRFLFHGRVLHIVSVDDVLDRRRELRIRYRELEGESS